MANTEIEFDDFDDSETLEIEFEDENDEIAYNEKFLPQRSENIEQPAVLGRAISSKYYPNIRSREDIIMAWDDIQTGKIYGAPPLTKKKDKEPKSFDWWYRGKISKRKGDIDKKLHKENQSREKELNELNLQLPKENRAILYKHSLYENMWIAGSNYSEEHVRPKRLALKNPTDRIPTTQDAEIRQTFEEKEKKLLEELQLQQKKLTYKNLRYFNFQK